jgi:predicted esterase
MVPRYADAIRSLTAIYIDAGKKDEWFLDNGAVAVKKELDALGVDCFFDLFDAGHMSIEYRYPKSLQYLCEQLSRD